MKDVISIDYAQALSEIKSRVITARIQAFRSVNKDLIQLYWDTGRIIVVRQEKRGWGQGAVERLAKTCTACARNFLGPEYSHFADG